MTWENGKWMKKNIGKMDEHLRKMDEQAEQRHKEMVKHFRMLEEMREETHREVIELLKRGFGDLSREHEEIKEKVS